MKSDKSILCVLIRCILGIHPLLVFSLTTGEFYRFDFGLYFTFRYKWGNAESPTFKRDFRQRTEILKPEAGG